MRATVEQGHHVHISAFGTTDEKPRTRLPAIADAHLREREEPRAPDHVYRAKSRRPIIPGSCAGSIFLSTESFDIPVVFFDFYVKDSNIDSVVIDNFYSGYQLTNLLIKKGHTHIGFVGNIYSTSSIQDRFLGYYRSLLEHKIPLNFAYVISDRNEDGQLIDLQLPEKMPTAFVCNNDQVAYYFINKLKEHGVRVPEDCSIVAFDNTIFSTISGPPITTVDTHVEELVEVVSKVIIKKINVPNKTYNRILVKASIIERESVRKVNVDRYIARIAPAPS